MSESARFLFVLEQMLKIYDISIKYLRVFKQGRSTIRLECSMSLIETILQELNAYYAIIFGSQNLLNPNEQIIILTISPTISEIVIREIDTLLCKCSYKIYIHPSVSLLECHN